MKQIIEDKIQVLTDLVSRAQLAGQLGMQYSGDRELYTILGYKENLQYSDYWLQYDRQDIAAAIVDKPAEATWRGSIAIEENSDAEETQLERAWLDICKELRIKSKLVSLDKLTCIGRYGVLFMGLSDAINKETLITEPKGKPKLLYIKVFSEGQATIDKFETNPTNSRYGLPLLYNLTIQNNSNGSSEIFRVHYSRVIHVVRNPLNDDVYGSSVLKKVFNRLMDLEKLTGGSAEMFWRGARPGYAGKLDEGYQLSADDEEELLKQLDEYEHNLRRILVNRGLSMESLTTQVSDPSSHVDIQIQMISAQTGIPKRILTGSERGELSSGQDSVQWKEIIQTRREEYAEHAILRPFIDRLMALGILPEAIEENYEIGWSDLFAVGDKERADIGRVRADALKQYASQPGAEYIIPPDAFFEFFLGLASNEIELINEMKEAAMLDESMEPEPEPEPEPTPTPE